jgi:hypothetical protein
VSAGGRRLRKLYELPSNFRADAWKFRRVEILALRSRMRSASSRIQIRALPLVRRRRLFGPGRPAQSRYNVTRTLPVSNAVWKTSCCGRKRRALATATLHKRHGCCPLRLHKEALSVTIQRHIPRPSLKQLAKSPRAVLRITGCSSVFTSDLTALPDRSLAIGCHR